MSDATGFLVYHWLWAAIFTGFAIFVLMRPAGFIAKAGCVRVHDEAQRERLSVVAERRHVLEAFPVAVKIVPAIASVAAAVVVAVTRVQPGLLYALVLLAAAASMAAGFLRMRNRMQVRVAVLAPRSAHGVIPAVWFGLAGLQAIAVLLTTGIRWNVFAAICACLVTLLCAWLARLIAEMPALIAGEDVPMEQVLDERLRWHRSGAVLLYGFVSAFVFVSQVIPFASTPLVMTAYGLTLAMAVLYLAWFFRSLRRALPAVPAAA